MGLAPAVEQLIQSTGNRKENIGVWELASLSLAVIRERGFPQDEVNRNGGAIAGTFAWGYRRVDYDIAPLRNESQK
ncbi:hypothetical protein EPH95_03325 [Salicibibacter halophilus]|uniref:Uncharacterized protein n=1 Tax=Salicibibacter halophilus TaxID=2502791 RepID=A0A514LNM6_9BACI|nr:hypothetical protein EPH95_03325 [Salicibibacter halophilus]